jgi:nucleoside 2-deoxyribosyltransferase
VKTCYLAGLISTQFTASLQWRVDAEHLLGESCRVLSPMRGKQDLAKHSTDGGVTDPHLTGADIILRDYHDVLQSDVILVNLNDFGSPRPLLGTIMELAFAWEHRIPVVAIASENNTLMRTHPFVSQAVSHYVPSLDAAVNLLVQHYLC